jgi:uncharacterized protein YgiM (DUF1202 family)
MALALVTILMPNPATAAEEVNGQEYGEDVSLETKPLEPSDPHSNLLATLGVTADLCHVFLQPTYKSHYFGPLAKGETVKWLDTQGDWIQVWIPRLRVAGWVQKTKVRETTEITSSPVKVPEDLLSILTVIATRANIREAPTTRSKIITAAQKDQEFWLLNKKKNWYQIWLPDLEKNGWVYWKLVRKRQKK